MTRRSPSRMGRNRALRAAQSQPAPHAPTVIRVDNKSNAAVRPTPARVLKALPISVAVVECQFGSRGDLLLRQNPDAPTDDIGATVGSARMVQQAGQIAPLAAVEVVPSVELKNINAPVASASFPRRPSLFAAIRLRLRDAFPGVFDHPRARRNRHPRIDAPSVDRGLRRHDPWGGRRATGARHADTRGECRIRHRRRLGRSAAR